MYSYLFNVDTVLLSKRTVVRRFRENDGESIFSLIDNNTSWLGDQYPSFLPVKVDHAEAEMLAREKLAKWLLQEEYCFGVWESKKAELIGIATICKIDWVTPHAEINAFIGHADAGQGLMTEALAHVVKFAFEQLKLHKLYFRNSTESVAAQRLARKFGFRREGDLREAFKKASGEFGDYMLFGLTRGEFVKA